MPFTDPIDIGPKPWGTETLLAHTDSYTLKKLIYRAGHQGALQMHVKKDEAFTLERGAAEVTWGELDFMGQYDPQRGLRTMRMRPGDTFHVPPGTPHKFRAITECVVYEASNPVFDDRVNVAEQYGDDDGQAR
jgi:mannose-6-phosphate isomerase-like protein (cupin superfamily)